MFSLIATLSTLAYTTNAATAWATTPYVFTSSVVPCDNTVKFQLELGSGEGHDTIGDKITFQLPNQFDFPHSGAIHHTSGFLLKCSPTDATETDNSRYYSVSYTPKSGDTSGTIVATALGGTFCKRFTGNKKFDLTVYGMCMNENSWDKVNLKAGNSKVSTTEAIVAASSATVTWASATMGTLAVTSVPSTINSVADFEISFDSQQSSALEAGVLYVQAPGYTFPIGSVCSINSVNAGALTKDMYNHVAISIDGTVKIPSDATTLKCTDVIAPRSETQVDTKGLGLIYSSDGGSDVDYASFLDLPAVGTIAPTTATSLPIWNGSPATHATNALAICVLAVLALIFA